MKSVQDIPGLKTTDFLEVPTDMSAVESESLINAKALFMEDIRKTVELMKQIKAGKKTTGDTDFLNK